MHNRLRRTGNGFTLVEVILITAMMVILMQLASVNLFRFQSSSSLDSSLNTLLSDARQQQMRAMSGDTAGTGTANAYGIYIEQSRYTLFYGTVYSAVDPKNFVINLDSNIRITATSLPSSQLIFTKGSGERNTATADHTITMTNTSSGQTKTVHFNRLGVITLIQ